MVILFVLVMSVIIVMGLECLKMKLIDNSLMFNVFVCVLYIVIVIMWFLKNNLISYYVLNL